ncbi:MAG TPA: dihydrolipoyl dehydrogenase, partial [Rhodoblastus sp.]|nr:dihydrolipoyl dehydrogenase [Rhodoblastus sp.]
MTIEIKVPDIGDFKDVPVIEVLVKAGDAIKPEDPLIVLESDKATMEVPSPSAGMVKELKVKVGDKVAEGSLILVLEEAGAAQAPSPAPDAAPAAAPAAAGGVDVKVPDIGDFKDVPVIEVMVKAGDTVKAEDPLIVLESDKATMEVPSPGAGVVKQVIVKVGDKVSEGSAILVLEGAGAPAAAVPAPAPAPTVKGDLHAEVLVLGAGPGGYTAAFRAADLGTKVVLVERWPVLGGVCLNVGCIPSKALLHAAKVIEEAHEMGDGGIAFAAPTIDLDKLRGWKESVVKRLTGGLGSMAKQRKVTVVTGKGAFASPNSMVVVAEDGSKKVVTFDKAIIAAGSEPVTLPFIPHDDARVIDSTGALELKDVPKRLLVLGGGIIGLEMATVYHALGSQITVVELMDQIIPGADKDIVSPLAKRIGKKYEKILLKTKVVAVAAEPAGLRVTFEAADGAKSEDVFDKLLVAVGRKPNGKLINVEAAGLSADERGFIAVDKQMRTVVPHIFAIGDIVGQPMLAHKATHEAKVAAEVACGHNSAFDAKVIPSVAYTDPEVAWVGVTETEAKAKGLKFGKASFPWAASGRALSLGRDEGATKVIFDEESKRLIGCGIVGVGAGDLIAEASLAIEM